MTSDLICMPLMIFFSLKNRFIFTQDVIPYKIPLSSLSSINNAQSE